MYKWEDDYVVDEKLKDGWYYIKLDLINPDGLEEALPPSRCIFVENGVWDNEWDIFPDDVESPTFKIGKEYEVSNDGTNWCNKLYIGYKHGTKNKHFCGRKTEGYAKGICYCFCRENTLNVYINNKNIDLTNEQIKAIRDICNK